MPVRNSLRDKGYDAKLGGGAVIGPTIGDTVGADIGRAETIPCR